MAKKNNIYKNVELSTVKMELSRNVGYLSTVDISTLNDEIEIVHSGQGPRPTVVASVEAKLDSYIVLIKDCITMLVTITTIEGEVSEYVENLIIKLEEHVKDIEHYFENRPPDSIQNREHFIEMESKKGYVYTIKIIAANIPTQIKNRSKIQKIILELKPIIASIKEARAEDKLLKGDKDIPPGLLHLYNK